MSPTTRLLSTSWAWHCDGQPPLTVTIPVTGRRSIQPRKLTVTRWSDGTTHVMCEGPVLTRGKPQPGKRAVGTADLDTDSCPAWVAYLAASVTGVLDEAIS